MNLSQLTRQEAKEQACRMAIRRGYAIIRRGNDLWRVDSNDNTGLLVRSDDLHTIWHSAISVMREENKSNIIDAPWYVRYAANIVHNAVIHPMMPFTWGRAGKVLDILHDFTGRIAFDKDID